VPGLYGAKYGGIPPESVEKMKTALVDGRSMSEF
jgi:hypothetical protein